MTILGTSLLIAAVAWEDPAANSENRLPPRTYAMPLASEASALTDELQPATPYVLSLDGDWKFHWTGDPALRPTDFYRTDYDDRDWHTIDVPSCVEMRGFGCPGYTNQKYPHADTSHPTNAAFAAIRDRQNGAANYNPVSSYRRKFTVPESWKGRRVILRFDGVYSAYTVWVNGKRVGYAEDSKLPSEFDVTPYLKEGQVGVRARGSKVKGKGERPTVEYNRPFSNSHSNSHSGRSRSTADENLLAVEVYRWCDGSFLEDQDMTRFSGIFRDVALWSMPTDGVRDFKVTTTPVGGYERWRLEVEVEGSEKVKAKSEKVRTEVSLYDADKKKIGNLTPLSTSTFSLDLSSPRLWSAEDPYLYTLVIRRGDDIRMKRIGFKEQKIVGHTFLVNGRPVKFKGVNRHETSPENGRTVSREEMLRDITLMKRYNVNAVRTSHYPNHRLWYDLCDRYGIYVMAEANVEGHEPGYKERGLGQFEEWAPSIVERNVRQVLFYRNHPSVTFWSLGNETGSGICFERARDAVKAIDPTRPIHWERGNGLADIDSAMYANVPWLEARGRLGDGLTNDMERSYFPPQTAGKAFVMCEYAHAMGNSLGHFKEYWDVFNRYESLAGGFVWDWIDQAVWKSSDKVDPKTGRQERYLAYGGDYDEEPNDANFNCNGVIRPDRKVSAMLRELGHVHRNLVVSRGADGALELENLFAFTAADVFDGEWERIADGRTFDRGTFAVPPLAPLSRVTLKDIPTEAVGGKETFLNVRFRLRQATRWAEKGWCVSANQVRLSEARGQPFRAKRASRPQVTESTQEIVAVCGKTRAVFSRLSGTLAELRLDGVTVLRDPALGVAAGPRLTWLRAQVDNDRWLYAEDPWHPGWGKLPPSGLLQPTAHVRTLEVRDGCVRSVVEWTGRKSAGFLHEMTWSFESDGSVVVENVVTPFGAQPPVLPRLGVSLKLDKTLDSVSWYGCGPHENYIDRCSSAFIGRWQASVADLEESYVRPQDNGYRSHVREVSFADADGRGVTFTASEPLFMQALRYGWEDMELARHRKKDRRMLGRIVPDEWTNLNLDIRQLGLGCASCGNNVPLPQYRFPVENVSWTMRISPFAKASGATSSWASPEERKAVECRVCAMDFNPGTPETDAARFYSNTQKTEFVAFNYDESKAGELGRDYTLEDPLTFVDGRTVVSAADWAKRRQELLAVFESEVYGRLPPKPAEMVFEVVSEKMSEDRFATLRTYRQYFRADKTGPVIDWFVAVPRHAKGRVPVFLHLNYVGLDKIAAKKTNHYDLPWDMLIANGYAFMSAKYTQITGDGEKRGGFFNGVCELWGPRDPKATDNPGSLMIWAWGLMRGLDLAEKIGEIDATRNVVIGSSRLGKAALLAAAYDERFKVCIPNQTGAVGVQLMKRNYGESLKGQHLSVPHWYCSAVWKYEDDPRSQPFDQHLLLACVAPRALLLECYHKKWFDPKGEWLAARAASPVWEFLTGKGLGADAWPEPYSDVLVKPPFGYVRRTECHGLSPYDWKWAIDFANEVLR